jgi:hypothetical protein
MSKRFMETSIWDQTWFLELSPEGKNIWMFLERSCDCAGIWRIDIPEMRRKIGNKNIDLSNFMEEVNRDYNKLTGEPIKRNRVMLIADNSKLWLTGFISFQYEKGTNGVNANIPAIKGALNRLKDENIYEYAIENGFLRITGEGEKEGTIPNTIDNCKDGGSEKEKVSSIVLINDFYSNSKGCRGSARDKDKDKDQDQEVLEFQDLNKEEEESAVHREPDKAGLLLERTWRKQNILPEEKRLVNEYIKKYGFDAVDFAFREGVKYNKMSLAYVDAICRKRKEKADQVEYRNRDKNKLHESVLRAEEQRKSGKGLTLVRDCFGKKEGNELRNAGGGG